MNILRPKISEQELAQMIMSRGYDYRELPDEKYPEYTIVWAIRGGQLYLAWRENAPSRL